MDRKAGLLLHPTSLPGSDLHGTLSDVPPLLDFLGTAGFSIWQVLPLNPTSADRSPYNSSCSFAGNEALLPKGWEQQADNITPDAMQQYRDENRYWLRDYALFTLIHRQQELRSWVDWPEPLRDRDPAALARLEQEHAQELLRIEQQQFLFDQQWCATFHQCQQRGITILGDLPFLCAFDSMEVWAHRDLFNLGPTGQPVTVSGVPPDYFSETGQLWGNPTYRWEQHQEQGFRWWIERFKAVLKRVDQVRFDHFRGLSSYWSVPADAEDARAGSWHPSPGDELLATLNTELGNRLPIIAEDLGDISPDVIALRDNHQLPGMVVLQFGFDGDPNNPHLPGNHIPHAIAYSGTHDNDTLVGWYQSLDHGTQHLVRERLGLHDTPPPLHWQMIDRLLASNAEAVILPMQDLLGLGSEQRMNIPGVADGNWRWRLDQGALRTEMADSMRALLEHHQRL